MSLLAIALALGFALGALTVLSDNPVGTGASIVVALLAWAAARWHDRLRPPYLPDEPGDHLDDYLSAPPRPSVCTPPETRAEKHRGWLRVMQADTERARVRALNEPPATPPTPPVGNGE